MTGAAPLRALLMLAALLCTLAVPSRAQTNPDAAPAKLVIGTMLIPPFVLRSDDGRWSGLSVDLWRRIAAEIDVPFEFRAYDYDLAGLLDAVEGRQVDAAVAAIPMTLEGESRFDFTHPYFAAGLGIAVKTEPQTGVLGTLGSFLTLQTLAAVGGLLGVLLVVGTLIWLLERRQQSQFSPRPAQGIGEGLWWAAVTMTTTGYGDRVPLSWRGRSFALVWMFASIFCIALFSATLSSSFVVGRLKAGIAGPADLPGARVAAVSGSAGEWWLNAQGLTMRNYPFVIQASKALQRGEVQALVHERPILGHMIKEYGWRELQLLPHTLAVREYAIALPAESKLKEPINRALLKIVHSPDWKEVLQKYVGTTDPVATSDGRN